MTEAKKKIATSGTAKGKPKETTAPKSADKRVKPATRSKTSRAHEDKWGAANIQAGWTCIPNILIRRQRTLGLDALDLNILLHLLSYWWESENLPHPSKETLAKAINVSSSTIQRRIRAMEAGGILKRVERRRAADRSETNLYDLTPLRALLEPHSEVEITERNAGRVGRRKRMTSVTKAAKPEQS